MSLATGWRKSETIFAPGNSRANVCGSKMAWFGKMSTAPGSTHLLSAFGVSVVPAKVSFGYTKQETPRASQNRWRIDVIVLELVACVFTNTSLDRFEM